MTTRMLIDARHQEETRVAVVEGNRIEELDFESAEHKQLKGNIYLAKVTRVEPSLQAAFVDYGGNRHGFLAFSEIHPDYYQIPKEDRERLLAEEAEHAAEEAALRAAEEDQEFEGKSADTDEDDSDGPTSINDDEDENIVRGGNSSENADKSAASDDDSGDSEDEAGDDDEAGSDDAENADGDKDASASETEDSDADKGKDNKRGRGRRRRGRGQGQGQKYAAKPSDEVRKKRMALRRRYKIQDVIHRRQVLLVQVVKEERGNKGAALTSYLSLAGRYCVLMPNTSHGGGISRKISNAGDRKRLKSIIADMKLPNTMGCIVRTAGLSRTKTEIKRDFDYLARLWDEIRENTLGASAPSRIHSDSDLIRRAIRDIYNRDIKEVLVEGPDGYRAAKDFMKLLMPSHAKRVQSYADPVPLFQRYGVEDQLSAMYQPIVQLKSGGYLVINPTEALVSIDINSGRSTKEHGIEATALSTNLEAAREIARQLRLRDMAGLVVIDFIDMEHHSNGRKVEKAMKEALKHDRARIQVGRISSFGLMEMSRQRLRTGVLEASSRECPHCEGTGLVRTASSSGLSALRLLEEEAAKGKGSLITLRASQEAVIYVLNNKRGELADIEGRYGVRLEILPDGETEGAKMSVASSGPRPANRVSFEPIVDDDDDDIAEVHDEEEEGEGRSRKRRRRRGRRGRRDESQADDANGEGGENQEGGNDKTETADGEDGEVKKKRSRRGRRGGRRRKSADGENGNAEDASEANATETNVAETSVEAKAPTAADDAGEADVPAEKPKRRRTRKTADKAEADKTGESEAAPTADGEEEVKPKRRGRPRKVKTDEAEAGETKAADAAEPKAEDAEEKPKRKPRASRAKSAATKSDEPETAKSEEKPVTKARKTTKKKEAVVAETAPSPSEPAQDEGPKRSGWWQRTFG